MAELTGLNTILYHANIPVKPLSHTRLGYHLQLQPTTQQIHNQHPPTPQINSSKSPYPLIPQVNLFKYSVPKSHPHQTLYNIHQTLYNIHQTLYNIHQTLYNIHQTLYNIHQTLYNIHQTLYNIHQITNYIHVGDDYHYLVICPYFYANRLQFIPKYVYEKPSVFKFCEFMSFKKKKVMVKIAKFCKIINKFTEVGL